MSGSRFPLLLVQGTNKILTKVCFKMGEILDKQELPFSQSVFKIVAAPPKDMTEMARAHQNVGLRNFH